MDTNRPPAPLLITASFVAEPLLPPLSALLDVAGLSLQPQLAPYHQVFQILLSAETALCHASGGADIILLRLEDYARDHVSPEDALASARQASETFQSALAVALRHRAHPLVCALLPNSPASIHRLGREIDLLRQHLQMQLQAMPGLTMLCDTDIARVSDGPYEDPEADQLAHIPYTDTHFAALALAVARKLHALLVPARKVLVLDCDNTLWHGVVGEDGAHGVTLPPGLLALQRWALQLQQDGVLLALASKNAEEDVQAVFDTRPDMLLQSHHIISKRINWLPKPDNLQSLAQELNLGLDAFVFMDDNPVECAQMRAALPQVVTVQLPADPDTLPGLLENLWLFDHGAVTAEDRLRTSMYQQNQARREYQAKCTHFADYIAALGIEIDIAAPSGDEWERIAQLSQRTNQFNFTTRRYTETELRQHGSDGTLRIRVKDRFGDYGLVGVATFNRQPGHLRVDSFFLSCRALGRGVEHALLARLGQLTQAAGLDTLCLPLRPTAKNLPAQAFADSVAARWRHPVSDGHHYLLPAEVAASIQYHPDNVPQEVLDAVHADNTKNPASPSLAASVADHSQGYNTLATRLVHGSAVLSWLHARQRQPRQLPYPAIPANDKNETAMQDLWSSVLQIDEIGMTDDFHALGGTSLQAARLIAGIEQRFGLRLPFTAILTSPTPRALLATLNGTQDSNDDAVLVTLRPGSRSTLFLIHDGDGETLLYHNLAIRLPEEVNIVGIEPPRRQGVPLAHARIETMAAAYIQAMQTRQASGPYHLAGMCAGGVIAYEMARQLRAAGHVVAFVMLMDAAAPGAVRRHGVEGQSHVERTMQAIRAIKGKLPSRSLAITRLLVQHGWRFLHWRCNHFLARLRRQYRVANLRATLTGNGHWSSKVPPPSIRDTYEEAERHYHPGPLKEVPVFLARATTGTGNDTPYTRLFASPDLGWQRFAGSQLLIADVPGGHASMLQPPHVDALAQLFRTQLEQP